MALSDALTSNTTLTELRISVTKCSDAAIVGLSSALETNTAVTKMSILTDLREAGGAALSSFLMTNDVLVDLALWDVSETDGNFDALVAALCSQQILLPSLGRLRTHLRRLVRQSRPARRLFAIRHEGHLLEALVVHHVPCVSFLF